jgi:hypothetical protein
VSLCFRAPLQLKNNTNGYIEYKYIATVQYITETWILNMMIPRSVPGNELKLHTSKLHYFTLLLDKLRTVMKFGNCLIYRDASISQRGNRTPVSFEMLSSVTVDAELYGVRTAVYSRRTLPGLALQEHRIKRLVQTSCAGRLSPPSDICDACPILRRCYSHSRDTCAELIWTIFGIPLDECR